MACRQKYTRNEATYFHASALFIVYFRLIIVWINVLHRYKSNMRILLKLVNMNLTASAPLKEKRKCKIETSTFFFNMKAKIKR